MAAPGCGIWLCSVFLTWRVSGVINIEQCFVASFSGLDCHVFLIDYASSMGRSFSPIGVLIESSSFDVLVIIFSGCVLVHRTGSV